jgi:hypothetical protein
MTIEIANCIITPPGNDTTVLFVKTKVFNDLSLPGKTITEGVDVKKLLIEAIKDKTDITVKGFKGIFYKIAYEAHGETFSRSIYVASDHKGVPTTRGDMNKFSIEIYSPRILFEDDWQLKRGFKLAPGIGKSILRYYQGIDNFRELYPDFVPLDSINIEEAVT